MITPRGHRYEVRGSKFMVVEPTGALHNSHMLRDLRAANDRTVAVNLKTGELVIHNYPQEKIMFLPEDATYPHVRLPNDYGKCINKLAAMDERGVIVCATVAYSFFYTGTINRHDADLALMFAKVAAYKG